jgi:hypothetical protein
MSTHTHRTKLDFCLGETADGDAEAQITYEYDPGEEPTGPSFGSAGEPGEGASISVEKVEIHEPKRNRWVELPEVFRKAVMSSHAMEEALIEYAEGR